MRPKQNKGDTIWPVAHFFWGYSVCLPLFFMMLWLAKRDVMVETVEKFFTRRAPVGAVGGLWSMIPDIDYFLEEHIFDKPWADIFLFHRSFDVVLPETDLFFAAEMFLLFAVVNLFAMAASVKTFERVNEALFGKMDDEEEEDTSADPNDGGNEEAAKKEVNGGGEGKLEKDTSE